jgi:hypothetical protein
MVYFYLDLNYLSQSVWAPIGNSGVRRGTQCPACNGCGLILACLIPMVKKACLRQIAMLV